MQDGFGSSKYKSSKSFDLKIHVFKVLVPVPVEDQEGAKNYVDMDMI